jgi:molybdate transport system regulatory protein
MEIKHKIWLEKDGHVVFGPGRDGLLKTIAEHQSLNSAAKTLKMSYRAAWGRIKASEKRLGVKLVEVDKTKQGMHLTDAAKKFIDRYDKLEKKIMTLLHEATREFS